MHNLSNSRLSARVKSHRHLEIFQVLDEQRRERGSGKDVGGVFIIKLVFIRLSRKLLITSSRVGTIISTFSLPFAFCLQHMNSLMPNADARRRRRRRKRRRRRRRELQQDEARRETKNRCSLDWPCLPTLVQCTCSLFWPSLLSVVLEAASFYHPVAV